MHTTRLGLHSGQGSVLVEHAATETPGQELRRLAGVRPSLREQTIQPLSESVADQIIQQLGGMHRIQAMIGPTLFVSQRDGVSLKFANKAARRPNYVLITLEPDDTYKMVFMRGRGMNWKTINTLDQVHAEDLRSFFTQETGLHLKL
jgi:hypothetical protein